MVTTRRQVRTEQDRYGGYSTAPSASFADTEIDVSYKDEYYENLSASAISAPLKVTVKETVAPPAAKPRLYTGRTATKATDIETEILPYPTRRRKSVRRETEDLMPTIKTRRYAEDFHEIKDKAVGKRILSTKAKVMLAVYLVAVVALVAVVIATGIAISGASSSVAGLEKQIEIKNVRLAEQSAELALLSDESALIGNAYQLDMEPVNAVTEVDLLPHSEPVVYAPGSNWFNDFCNWLDGLIGG